jgi:hypothetical protein
LPIHLCLALRFEVRAENFLTRDFAVGYGDPQSSPRRIGKHGRSTRVREDEVAGARRREGGPRAAAARATLSVSDLRSEAFGEIAREEYATICPKPACLAALATLLVLTSRGLPSLRTAPNVRPCDWTDERRRPDDGTGEPATNATDICKLCSIALTPCFDINDCPMGETCGPSDGYITICGGPPADNIAILTLNNSKNYQVCGFGGNDKITLGHTSAWAAHNPVIVDGGDGDDTIVTIANLTNGSGYTIYGGNGHDKITGSEGMDTIYAAVPPWSFIGNDVIDGKGGNDTISGSNRSFVFGFYVEEQCHPWRQWERRHQQPERPRLDLRGRRQRHADRLRHRRSEPGHQGHHREPALRRPGQRHAERNRRGTSVHGRRRGGGWNAGNDPCTYTYLAPGGRPAGVWDVGTLRNCNADSMPVPCGCD